MVALGHLRKSKPPTVPGSPIADDNPPTPSSLGPQVFTAPIPRNFSYPTSISTSSRTQNWPGTLNRDSSNCGQLGEAFIPSPCSGPKGRTWSEELSFSKSGHHPNAQPQKHNGVFATQRQLGQLDLNKPSLKQKEDTRKKQRRSTLLSLSSSYTRSKKSIEDTLGPKETRGPSCNPNKPNKPNKSSKVFSFGDYTLPHKTPRLKRTSLVHHKTASSFDASQLVRVYTTSPQRPVSSSQACAPPTRAPEPALEAFPSYPWEHFGRTSTPQSQLTEQHPTSKLSRMNPNDSKVTGEDRRSSNGGRKRGNSTSEVDKRKGKEGKGRWLSQLKEWVSVSEPSTQALKQHKRTLTSELGSRWMTPELERNSIFPPRPCRQMPSSLLAVAQNPKRLPNDIQRTEGDFGSHSAPLEGHRKDRALVRASIRR
ncbi:hypothetical protein PG993_001910 [Apiospora rasikravindrae]|uniref:Uncharacterized protein n=1 Tax=Apiospora rasikravindrae TaxID=990691 RepID=A0ABR1UCR4_9PEZI